MNSCFLYPPPINHSVDRLDIRAARILLDNDHYAMAKLKKRVLEYLAVRQLKNNLKGPILCFVGPPGVGKTSVGRSIAKTLGREFHRIALGGVCDQSDIRGHRYGHLGVDYQPNQNPVNVPCYISTVITDSILPTPPPPPSASTWTVHSLNWNKCKP